MTSTSSETRPFRIADLGTLVVMAWSGDAPDGDMPYLLASSLGDGEGGPEASAVAVEQLLAGTGLPVGGDIVDGSTARACRSVCSPRPVRPSSTCRSSTPGASRPRSGSPRSPNGASPTSCSPHRPWPEAQPGKPIEPEALAAIAGAEETLSAAAHVILPARSLR